MKIKLTPLFIIAIIVFVLGGIAFFGSLGDSIGPVVAIAIIATGILAMAAYFILRVVFPAKIKAQFIAEIIIIGVFWFCYTDFTEKVVLRAPRSFNGYVMVVYGVDNQPIFKNGGLFSKKTDVVIPKTGILLTLAKINDIGISVVDSLDGNAKLLTIGSGVQYFTDTLACGSKKYQLTITYLHGPYDWDYNADTINRRIKKEEACSILSKLNTSR